RYVREHVRRSLMGDQTGGRNIAEYDWCDVVYGDCTNRCETDAGCDCIYPEIHAPHPDVVGEFDDWDGDPVEGTSACGKGVRLLIPGLFSRMGTLRCDHCCDLWGLPYGKG